MNRPDSVAPDPSALTPGQRLYLAEYDLLPAREPAWRYLVLSPQRTGSNYLCRRLCNVRGRFGMPSEYLNPAAVRLLAPRLLPGCQPDTVPFATYMQAVQRVRTSADGCFGLKLQPAQLAAVAAGDRALFEFAASFDRIVALSRRDKLGQAISGTIAQLTGTWFNDGTPPKLEDERLPQLLPAIAGNLARYVEEDRRIAALAKALDRPWLRLEYEDIVADGQAVFGILVDFLLGGNDAPLDEAPDVQVPERPSTEVAERIRARFLDYINGQSTGTRP
jgi:LPS sulfotransferase NodH